MLVHCHAGVSRSATVCMAYVMKSLNLDLRSAYDFVKTRRSCVSPNLHFMGQLLEFEKCLGRCTAPTSEADRFSSNSLVCVQEEEEEVDVCSLPRSWINKEKRRAVSTPASLEISPYSVPIRKAAAHTPSPVAPNTSSSLPCTPLPGPWNHTHQRSSPLCGSCSLQSLALSPVTTQTPPLAHRHVTESL